MDVSFQLYSARSISDQHGFLQKLSALGYTQVEGYGGVYDDSVRYKEALDQAGLSMVSGHFGLPDLLANTSKKVELAKQLGMQKIYVPYLTEDLRPSDLEGYKKIAEQLREIQLKVLDAGLDFGWHNHDFELTPLADGTFPLDVMLNEVDGLAWEADLAWVAVANQDPKEWVQKYAERITAIHVKDLAKSGENADEDGWADVGHGVMQWEIIASAIRASCDNPLLVVEHDNPSDVDRFASVSIKNLNFFYS